MAMMPLFTPEEREETTGLVSRLLRDDSRVEGIVVVGSLAGRPDRASDMALAAVVAAITDPAAVAADWVSRLYEVLPLLHHVEPASGGALVRGFLLESMLEVDLAFTLRAQY